MNLSEEQTGGRTKGSPVRAMLAIALTAALQITSVFAADLAELQVTNLPSGATFVVRDPKTAVLVVQTTVAPLGFESNMGIIRVDNPRPGEYMLYLPAGTNLVTFKAEGYVPLRERFVLEAKRAIAVKVAPKRRGAEADERPEIKLFYQPPPGSPKVSGSLDNRILNLDFSQGYATLRPEAGERKLRLVSGGTMWEKSFLLDPGQKVEDSVRFVASNIAAALPPATYGGLYITSPITSVKVYLNDVYAGLTPLTLDSVQAGTYDLRLERSLHLPSALTIEVRPLEYAAHDVRLTPTYGVLKVESDPPGALVKIEGVEQGRTPIDEQRLNEGSYHIELSRPYYADADTLIDLKSGDTLTVAMTLKAKFGTLAINSIPSGADVILNGRKVGVTPHREDTLRAGFHSLTLRLRHYFDLEDELTVGEGESLTKEYSLKVNYAVLNLTGAPQGATIKLEGEENLELKLPIYDLKVSPGIYRLTAEEEGYRKLNDVLVLEIGQTDTVEINLQRYTGSLKVSSIPQGATIIIDGVEYGKTPTFLHDVPTGWRHIRLDKSGYDLAEDSVLVDTMGLGSVSWELSTAGTKAWKKARRETTILSGFLPGMGQIVGKRPLKGILWIGALGWVVKSAIDAKSEYSNWQNKYSEADNSYQGSQSESMAWYYSGQRDHARREMTAYNQDYQTLIAVAGGIYLLQIADAWYFPAGNRPRAAPGRIEMGMNVNNRVAMVMVSLQLKARQ